MPAKKKREHYSHEDDMDLIQFFLERFRSSDPEARRKQSKKLWEPIIAVKGWTRQPSAVESHFRKHVAKKITDMENLPAEDVFAIMYHYQSFLSDDLKKELEDRYHCDIERTIHKTFVGAYDASGVALHNVNVVDENKQPVVLPLQQVAPQSRQRKPKRSIDPTYSSSKDQLKRINKYAIVKRELLEMSEFEPSANISESEPPTNNIEFEPPANISESEPPANISQFEPSANIFESEPPANISEFEPPTNISEFESPANISESEPPTYISEFEPPTNIFENATVYAHKEPSGILTIAEAALLRDAMELSCGTVYSGPMGVQSVEERLQTLALTRLHQCINGVIEPKDFDNVALMKSAKGCKRIIALMKKALIALKSPNPKDFTNFDMQHSLTKKRQYHRQKATVDYVASTSTERSIGDGTSMFAEMCLRNLNLNFEDLAGNIEGSPLTLADMHSNLSNAILNTSSEVNSSHARFSQRESTGKRIKAERRQSTPPRAEQSRESTSAVPPDPAETSRPDLSSSTPSRDCSDLLEQLFTKPAEPFSFGTVTAQDSAESSADSGGPHIDEVEEATLPQSRHNSTDSFVTALSHYADSEHSKQSHVVARSSSLSPNSGGTQKVSTKNKRPRSATYNLGKMISAESLETSSESLQRHSPAVVEANTLQSSSRNAVDSAEFDEHHVETVEEEEAAIPPPKKARRSRNPLPTGDHSA